MSEILISTPSYPPTSRSTFTLTETLDTSSDSSDEEAQELRINKEMNKSRLHRSKVKHLFHPPGRALLKTEEQQQAIPDEEIRDVAPRKKRSSNNFLRSDKNEQIEDICNSDRKPEQAKIGETVRFMYHQPDGMACYWIQGKLTDRLDKYRVARTSNIVKNRFKVEQVKVITYWGVRGVIPETFIINLSRSTLWSLGTETLVTTKKDEVITCKEDEVYETLDENDETTNETSTNNETRPPNLFVTKQNMNESDLKYLAESDVEDETDVQGRHSCDRELKEEVLEQHKSGATPGDILWTLKNERLKEGKDSHEKQSEDIVKSLDRFPKKEPSGKNDSRIHEIFFPD